MFLAVEEEHISLLEFYVKNEINQEVPFDIAVIYKGSFEYHISV